MTPDKQILAIRQNCQQTAKSFIPNLYNECYAEQVTKQLQKGTPLADIHNFFKFGTVENNACWISNLYDYLYSQKEIICNGFKADVLPKLWNQLILCRKE